MISQDTSAYGSDLKYVEREYGGQQRKTRITELCEALSEFNLWVRLHYVYPYPHVDELFGLMADGKLLPYLDIPFQHSSPKVLKAMRRPAAGEKTLDRIASWRQQVPELALRSSFIVGFPGETDEDFEHLLAWLAEAKLDRVGCFRYEPVSGAASNALAGTVEEEVVEERWHRLMEAQQDISAERLALRVGTQIDVLVDEISEEGAIGRSKGDAPEIDGQVFLPAGNGLAPGDIVRARVEHAGDYDLWAVPVTESSESDRSLA